MTDVDGGIAGIWAAHADGALSRADAEAFTTALERVRRGQPPDIDRDLMLSVGLALVDRDQAFSYGIGAFVGVVQAARILADRFGLEGDPQLSDVLEDEILGIFRWIENND